MVKDTLNSVFDNLKERATNPFLGTLIVVWLVKNWKLVYSLFYFDGQIKLEDRLKYIDKYFKDHSFLLNLVFVILITLGVLILTYILLTISRLLTDFYERIVIPWISKVTDRSTVVLKVEYNKLLEEVKRLETRLDEERLSRITAQNERDDALKSKEIVRDEVVIDGNGNSPALGSANKSDLYFDEVTTRIRSAMHKDEFDSIISDVLNRNTLSKHSEKVHLLLREGLIKLTGDVSTSVAQYSLTDEGKLYMKYWNKSR
ncbi:MAG: hypothetical protein EOO89_19140 [Pedobacter sp.]|nr:MAG: hypothetical protein EOO89_19140 [Pedobacter sp.]